MIEPYYTLDGITIYHGDALDVMPRLPVGCAKAVVTDPPYIIGAVSAGNMGTKAGGWHDMMNSASWFSTWYRQVDRLLRRDGSFWTFCNWRSLPVIMRAAIDADLPVTSVVVWDKEWIGPGGHQGLRPAYEMIALLAQPDFAVVDRGVPDVWRHKVGSYKEHGHPAEKPEPLVRRVIQTAEVGSDELVLDPFMGSGIALVAARALGVQAIGIEADERWCELAVRRLGQAVLFGGTGDVAVITAQSAAPL